MPSTMERRHVANEMEVRAAGDGKRTLTGYAAVFGRYSSDLGGFVERIAAGAFAKTIQESDIRVLVNHDASLILGRSLAGVGTARLAEDSQGLHYEVDLPGTQAARDLSESIERGDVTGSSFAFSAVGPDGDEWSKTEQDYPLRTVNQARLYDVGPVTYPAYEATGEEASQVAVRSLASRLGLPDLSADADAIREALNKRDAGESQREPEQPSTPAWLAEARDRMKLAELVHGAA